MKKKNVLLGLSLLSCTIVSLTSCVKKSNDNKLEGENKPNSTNTDLTTPSSESNPVTESTDKEEYFTVTWKNYNGEVLKEESVKKGTKAIYDKEEPKRESTKEFTYTFKGWNQTPSDVFSDIEYTAVFNEIKNKYTYSFYDELNNIIKSESIEYGMPISKPEDPIKESMDGHSYEFVGWYTQKDGGVKVEDFSKIENNVSFYARFSDTLMSYTYTFLDENNNVIKTDKVKYGSEIVAPNNPQKASDNTNTYEFAGWANSNGEIVDIDSTIKSDVTYKAVYTPTYINYEITFFDEDGTTLLSKKSDYHYNDVITLPENPTKANTAEYTYEFTGYDKIITNVLKNESYKAVYKATKNKYLITFVNDDDTVLLEQEYEYGKTPVYSGTPLKASDNTYTYEFSGFDDEIVAVTGAKTYKALYTPTYINYEITFYDEDGTTILSKKSDYHYNDVVTLPENPTKEGNLLYSYNFIGYDKVISNVLKNESYKAVYEKVDNKYTIIWKNYDGSILKEDNDALYTKEYDGTPVRLSEGGKDYTFVGFDEVINDKVITRTAKYIESTSKIKVTWKNYDGSILEEDLDVLYGSESTYDGTTPTRENTLEFTFEFDGWDKSVDTSNGNVTYTAKYKETKNKYLITFTNYDDTVLLEQEYEYGTLPVYEGTPSKEADNTYTYEFNGFDNEIVAVTGAKTYKALYTPVYINYEITFYDEDGITVISKKSDYHYNDQVVIPQSPTKDNTAEYTYEFSGYDKVITNVLKNESYKAVYKATKNKYLITFVNYDDTVLLEQEYEYGTLPVYEGTPSKEADNTYTYEFTGFDSEISAVTGAKTYKALYTPVYINYEITFYDEDGITVLSKKSDYHYNDVITLPENPTKANTAEYTYEFIGYDKTITNVLKNDSYKAVYKATKNKYTYSFYDEDGNLIKTETLEYGLNIVKPNDPTKASTKEFTYEFAGWYTDITSGEKVEDFGAIVKNVSYYARFNNIKNKYTYTFYDEDGLNIIASNTVEYGTIINQPVVSNKPSTLLYNYEFIGFYDSKVGGNLIINFEILDNQVYYARFNEADRLYTITWKNYDGSVLKTDLNSKYSKEYDGITPVKDLSDGKDYVFDSWYETIISDSITRQATFNEAQATYNVVFKNEDDSVIKSLTVLSGELVSYDTKPTKPGYKFMYWSLDGNKFDLTTPINKNIELKAVFNEIIKVGFSSELTLWQTLEAEAGTKLDSSNRKVFASEVSMNNFTFKSNDKNRLDSGIYNNQGSDITIELTTDFTLVMDASWASGNKGYVRLLDENNNELYVSNQITSSGTSASFNIDLEAGFYTIHSDYSIKIKALYYEIAKEYVEVSYVTNASSVEKSRIVKGMKLDSLPVVFKGNYKLIGWYKNPEFSQEFDINEAITSDLVLYAKWEELKEDEKAKVTLVSNISNISFDAISVAKNSKITLPNEAVEGYRFSGWYTDQSFNNEFDEEALINEDITLYANYIKQYTITYKDLDNNTIAQKLVDTDTPFSMVATINPPYVEGKIFAYWSLNGTDEYEASNDITSNITLKPVYENESASVETINITKSVGMTEAAYILFDAHSLADNYSIYNIDNQTSPKKLGHNDYYLDYQNGSYRVDLFGLTKGSHKFMVVPEISGTDVLKYASQASVEVDSYDRSGFAHYNYTAGVGAYKDNGELKENAIVLYVTDNNKNTVELSYAGITVKGIGNILNSSGQTAQTMPNTNKGILKKLAENNIPLVIRFVGVVSNTGLYHDGTFNASNNPLIEGLTHYDSTDCGGTVGDNGHMARIKSGKDITIEGVGEGATIDGFGFHFMAESSATNLGKSFEVRNLKFINTPEDAVGMEGVQSGSTLTASVERCWIHNNEFYCPHIEKPAESDKAQGDGSCDFKRGQYFTCSYNYFEACHKTNLVGASDSNLQFNLTYHHNYWYLCESRGPLARQANIHMYNNIFFGQISYAMNPRANAYIYSEYNLFYACKNPMQVKSGAIKSFNDVFSSAIGDMQGTIVTDKNQKVSSGNTYENFDTIDGQSYIKTGDYLLQTDMVEAKKVIMANCGTYKASNKKASDMTMQDVSYLKVVAPNATVNNINVTSEKKTVTPGKISNSVYAFKIDNNATVKITYASDSDTQTGVLMNEAGIALMKASGSIMLKPGTYYIQCNNIQAGEAKSLTLFSFKEFTISQIEFELFNSAELDNQLKDEFNQLCDLIPSNIEYNDDSYNKINNALNKYESLPANVKNEVTTNYNKVISALNTYKTKGISYVEGKINEIITPVTKDNSNLVFKAREAYNELISKIADASVSNLNKLTEAEAMLEDVAVAIFHEKVNALPASASYTEECKALIDDAIAAYEILTLDQQQLSEVVTDYNKLMSFKNAYDLLEIEANKITISFVAEGLSIDPVRISKNSKVTLPSVSKDGYRLEGWYTNSGLTTPFNSNSTLTENTTLYAKFIKQYEVTFKDSESNLISTIKVDKDSSLTNLVPSAPYIAGYKFKYWSTQLNGTSIDLSDGVTSNLVLYAVYEESSIMQVNVIESGADLEAVYAEFEAFNDMTDYNVYYKLLGNSYKLADKELIRLYKDSSNYYRVDIVGIKEGNYSLKIVPVNGNTELSESATEISNLNVKAHIREGFAFVNGTSNGAYENDGTLNSKADVIYVTNANKDTISYNTINKKGENVTVTGVQNIITNLKSNKNAKPLSIRFIGNILDPANMPNGDLYVDDVTSGLTIEGIGLDATMNGFGIVVKNSSNVEIRNLGFMNCNSSEGDSIGLQQKNDHVWVHNCDIFYGDAGSDADQAKGDGALDTKTSTYITHSFNHFYDTGKSNLQGMKSESTDNYITYHHNWYDHSDSRHPRIRTCTVHIYNNYFDGIAKYGVGMTMGGSAFVENNYFRSTATLKPMLISGQGTDAQGEGTFSGEAGGIIKAYNNKFDGNVSYITQKDNQTSFDAYEVDSRNETIPSSVKALSGGSIYNNFDTNSSLMYSYNVDTPDDAKLNVTNYAGRIQGGDFKWTFNNEVDDKDYSVNKNLKSALVNYKSKLVSVLSSNGAQNQEQEENELTANDVIALINALPNPSSVTLDDTAAIYDARSNYNKLSDTEKEKVTNYSKLQECLQALNNLGGNEEPTSSELYSIPYSGSFFNVVGNTTTKAGTRTYNSNTYTTALKMESSTNVSFTLNKKATIKIVLSQSGNNNVKVDGVKTTGNSDNIIVMELEAGTHTITKADVAYIFVISIEY